MRGSAVKPLSTIAVPIGFVALICVAAVAWHFFHANAAARTLMEQAKVYRAQAEHGDSTAQYELARLYYQGKGVPQDYSDAFDWYRKSAEQGNVKAQYGVGFMYEYGKGVPQDYVQAVYWCGKAADQGYGKAQYVLGWNYYYGLGVPRDYTEGLELYRKAANQGDAPAQNALGYAYTEGKGMPTDDLQAVEWYRRAADQGYAKAQDALGYAYSEGKGVPRDYTQSARWYRKASKQGDEYAQRALDAMKIRPSSASKIMLTLVSAGSILLLIGPWKDIRNQQRRKAVLAGLLGLLWVGLDLYGYFQFPVLLALSIVNPFIVGKGILSGISIVMLLSVALPQALKIALGFCGVLFVGWNIHTAMDYEFWHLTPIRGFYSINALLFGQLITLTVLVWQEYHKTRGIQKGNDDIRAAEPNNG